MTKRINKTKKLEKFFTLFVITLLISTTIASASAFAPYEEKKEKKDSNENNIFIKILDFLMPGAQAADCCVKNNDASQFCKNIGTNPGEISADDCNGADAVKRNGFDCDSVSGVPECKQGVCVATADGSCLAGGKKKAECIHSNNGQWFDTSNMQNVEQCREGCCVNAPKSSCTLESKSKCEKAGRTFKEDITSEQECNLECAGVEYACCQEGSTYENKHRSECTEGIFHTGYCSQISGSGVGACTDIRPGNGMTDGDKFDCYCYDSSGKREGIAGIAPFAKKGNLDIKVEHKTAEDIAAGEKGNTGKCSYPDEYCTDTDGAAGKPAYCKSTECVEKNDYTDKINFRTSESLCVNVPLGHFNPGARSKYLQNYKLICNDGKIEADTTLDPEGKREEICIEKDENGYTRAKAVKNRWKECLECGKDWSGGITDVIGYVALIGPPLANLIGNTCGEKNLWTLGAGDKCDTIADKSQLDGEEIKLNMCGGGRGEKGDVAGYDYDLWPPLGSCNPTYPPGTSDKCGECGGGGDSLTNVCTEEECEHMGDCKFQPDFVGSLGGMFTAGMVAVATLGGVYLVCNLFGVTLLGGPSLCASFASTTGAAMISATPSLFYWGLYATVFGFVASFPAQVDRQKNLALTPQGKIKMKDAIIAARAASQTSDVSGGILWTAGGFGILVMADVLTRAFAGKAITIGTAPGTVIAKNIGETFYAKQLEDAVKAGDTAKILEIQKNAGIPGEMATNSYKAADAVAKGKEANEYLELSKIKTEALTPEQSKSLGELVQYKDKTGGVLKDAKTAADGAPGTGSDVAKSATKTAEAGTTLWTAVLNWGIIFINLYFAGRAMNTGSCVPEDPLTVDDKKKIQEETQVPWDQICEKCGWGEGQPFCTKERCDILGAGADNCVWYPLDGVAGGKCFTKSPTDVTPPKVNSIKIEFFDDKKNLITRNTGKTEVTTSGAQNVVIPGEMPYNTTYIKLHVTTNEPSQCGWTLLDKQGFDATTKFPKQSSFPNESHSDFITFSRTILPATFKYVVKCRDIVGKSTPALEDFYYVKFDVQGGPDYAPPTIEWINPIRFVALGTTNIDLEVIAYDKNNVSKCEWFDGTNWQDLDRKTGTSKGKASCLSYAKKVCDAFKENIVITPICRDFEALDIILLNLPAENRAIFESQWQTDYTGMKNCFIQLKCTDDTPQKNVYAFNNSLIMTPQFTMTLISPAASSTITDKHPLINVTTLRPTICNYTITSTSPVFSKTYSFGEPPAGEFTHSSIVEDILYPTTYTLKVLCEDIAGTQKTSTTTFTVSADDVAPVITRIYYKNGLYITTDKKSICGYSTDKTKGCTFDLSTAEKMFPEYLSLEHSTTNWISDTTYYIICKNEWDEEDCKIIQTLGQES